MVVMIGCKKSNPDPAQVVVSVSHAYDNQGFSLYTTYTNALGQQYYYTLSNIYLGQLVLTGDKPASFPGQYISITPELEEYAFGEAEASEFGIVSFIVGVDSLSNHADPTTFDESSPLHPGHPRYQHWSWNDGYIFIRIEGMADTSADLSAGPTEPFFYHVGLDMNRIELDFPVDLTAVAGEQLTIPLIIDYKRFLDNIDFRTELRTHTMNNMPLAAKVKDNVAGAITLSN